MITHNPGGSLRRPIGYHQVVVVHERLELHQKFRVSRKMVSFLDVPERTPITVNREPSTPYTTTGRLVGERRAGSSQTQNRAVSTVMKKRDAGS